MLHGQHFSYPETETFTQDVIKTSQVAVCSYKNNNNNVKTKEICKNEQ